MPLTLTEYVKTQVFPESARELTASVDLVEPPAPANHAEPTVKHCSTELIPRVSNDRKIQPTVVVGVVDMDLGPL